MCGILAVFNQNGLSKEAQKYIANLNLLEHRGPDFKNYHFNAKKTAFLGHTRLSILDLSELGNQPFVDFSRKFYLVFNGQIYNYKSIREKRIKEGATYISNSDTEVLFKELIRHKLDCLDSLKGMWSFVLWDEDKEEIMASRDRFGIKPLYYFNSSEGDLCFCSEINPILNLYPESKVPNIKTIQQYISRGWIDHSEETFFLNIKQIPPASFLKISKKERILKNFWNLPEPNEGLTNFDILKKIYINSVFEGINSDVAIATTLSGGIDSGSINCTLAKELNLGSKIKAFSVQPENTPDESYLINDSINHTGIKHSFYSFKEINILETIDKLIFQMQEPFFNASTIYQNHLRECISKNGFKVVLTGDGADEIFSGYSKLLPIYIGSLIKDKNYELAELALKNGKDLSGLSEVGLIEKVNQFLNFGIGGRLFQEHKRGYEIISKEDYPYLDNVLFPEIIHNHLDINAKGFLLFKELSDRFKIDVPHHLRNEDRNSMSYGIESRPLFLDHQLLETVWSFPYELLMFSGTNKYMLRQIMKNTLNKKVLNFRKKYVRPGNNKAISYGPLRKKIKEYIDNDSFKIFSDRNRDDLSQMYKKDLYTNSSDNAYPWFRFYSAIRWLEIFNFSL